MQREAAQRAGSGLGFNAMTQEVMQVKQGVALADVAAMMDKQGAERHVAILVTHGHDQAVAGKQWLQMVRRWYAAFAGLPGQEIGFYFEDALAFSAALWGAWHAGKTPVLLSDLQSATTEALLPSLAGTAGQLPGAVTLPADVPSDTVLPPFDMQAARLVLFTSGSTGKPERIGKQVRQLNAEVQALEAAFGAALGDGPLQVLATVSHQHIYGLLFRVLWPLSAGRMLGTCFARYPEDLLAQLRQAPACVLVSSPAMLGRLPQQLPWGDAPSRLSAIFSSGGPLAAEASAHSLAVLGHSPTEVFGSSETGGIAWRRRAELGEVWQTLPGVAIQLDADSGLLKVRSPHLPDPALWWETADRAEASSDGASFVLRGRVDRIVKIAEKRVSLTALEQALQASDWVHAARAVLIERRDLPTRVGMVLALSDAGWQHLQAQGRQAMAQALRALLAGQVERVALPRSWRYVVRMPMNAQSKVTQQSLLALFDPMMPAPQWISRSQTEACARLQVVAELRVLDGHFPQALLIPGVAQLHWALSLARQAFDLSGPYSRGEVIKIQQPILPGDTVEVQLHWLADKGAIQFAIRSARGMHASGRLLQPA